MRRVDRKSVWVGTILALVVILLVATILAVNLGRVEANLRGLQEITPPMDVVECLEFEIGAYPYIVDDGAQFPILQQGGHGFSFIGVNLWFQHLPGGYGEPWALGLNFGSHYKDAMIKKRFLNDFLVLGAGYQYQTLTNEQRFVYLIGLRWNSISVNYRPAEIDRITIGLEVR